MAISGSATAVKRLATTFFRLRQRIDELRRRIDDLRRWTDDLRCCFLSCDDVRHICDDVLTSATTDLQLHFRGFFFNLPAMIPDKLTCAAEIIKRLKSEYPEAHCALNHQNAFELLVATILSAQCTDERVNIVTETLFRKYRSPRDFLSVEQTELETDIHSTGFFRNKAKSIQGACEKIIENFGGEIPNTMEEMLTLNGVARKTANVVLGNAFGIASGVVVDTHVSRLSQRLGLTENITPEKIEKDLAELVPQEDWILFPHLLISHGRKICQARKPECEICVLNDVCPKIGVTRISSENRL